MLKNAIWLFIFSIVILLVFLPSYTQMQDLRQRNLNLKKEIQWLKGKNAQLREERRLLEQDPVYLEKVGREKMGLVKEGEFVFKLVPVDGKK